MLARGHGRGAEPEGSWREGACSVGRLAGAGPWAPSCSADRPPELPSGDGRAAHGGVLVPEAKDSVRAWAPIALLDASHTGLATSARSQDLWLSRPERYCGKSIRVHWTHRIKLTASQSRHQ